MTTWTPGTRVRAHKATWVVQSVDQTDNGLRLRALALDGKQTRLLNPEDGIEPLAAAAPSVEHQVDQEGAKLLRDALLLSTRRGAGPFRSLGGIAIQPHAYQIVPLMMALSQTTVRLLIADGTGIGKTVEAGLIVREMLDRGDIGRFTVLVPPHLVDQWVNELRDKFHLNAAAVTTRTINALERQVPVGTLLFQHFPHTVVSLDYIKSDKHFAEFKHMCPECVVVDEAHACVGGSASQQRYRLLRVLAKKAGRHMILCSATPHAGDAKGFGRLLALLDPTFAAWDTMSQEQRGALAPTLQRHLVQRMRQDLEGWEEGDTRLFPQRETRDAPYALSESSQAFFETIFAHCKARIEATADENERRRVFWSGMALLSCISSSPGAALSALSAPVEDDRASQEDATGLNESVLDEKDGGFADSDREPRRVLGAEAPRDIVRQAQALVARGPAADGKLDRLLDEVRNCLAQGHNPIVFCHFVSTAEYVGKQLELAFPKAKLAVVTGRNGNAAQREAAVMQLHDAPRRILVATDCLSEGVNLQGYFDAVIHYDLSWNPMRLQQREGRVDRLGQMSPRVVCVTLHGPNNPIDAAMLTVLQHKATCIRSDLGIEVWLPDQGTEATRQLMGDLLTHGGKALRTSAQVGFKAARIAALDAEAKGLLNIGKAQRRYAQQHLRPDEVIPEWRNALATLGGFEDLQGFVIGALTRLRATLSRIDEYTFSVQLDSCMPYARRRFDMHGLRRSGTLRFAPVGQSLPNTVNRGHALVTALADLIEEQTRSKSSDDMALGFLGCSGCWVSRGVEARTVVLLVRLNHRLQVDGKTHDVSETSALAWTDDAPVGVKTHMAALALLSLPAVGDVSDLAKKRNVAVAKELRDARLPELEAFKQARASALLADHLRMRRASQQNGEVSVMPLHLEEMGLYVLLPES
jgi:superfamily II DNA or RNA helicase